MVTGVGAVAFIVGVTTASSSDGSGSPSTITTPSVTGAAPFVPTPGELLAAKKCFPPNYLHESWLDFLYWDTEIEP